MNIRKIEQKDVNEVSLLMMRNFDEIMKKYHSHDVIEKFKTHVEPDQLKQQMVWKDILVVEESNIIVATGALANFGSEEKPKYSISNFFVKPEMHRSGVGSVLFSDLLKIAKDKGAKTFHVPSSRNAVDFYAKMGFLKDTLQPDEDDEITWMSMTV